MPTYEYRCPQGHEFESFVQKMSDAKSVLPCPSCGVVAQRRMSAGSGFLFKGSGFYITDYGKDGKKDQRDAAAKAKEAPATATAGAAAAPASAGSSPTAAPAASGSAPAAAAAPAPAKPSSPSTQSAPSAPTPKSGPEK